MIKTKYIEKSIRRTTSMNLKQVYAPHPEESGEGGRLKGS